MQLLNTPLEVDFTRLKSGDIVSHNYLYRTLYNELFLIAIDLPVPYEYASTFVNHCFIQHWLRCGNFDNLEEVKGFLYISLRSEYNRVNYEQQAHRRDFIEKVVSGQTRRGFSMKEFLVSIKCISNEELDCVKEIINMVYKKRELLRKAAYKLRISFEEAEQKLEFGLRALHFILSNEDFTSNQTE